MQNGGGAFSGVESFYGKNSSGVTVSGKEREVWITSMKRALFSSGLAKDSWANKTLTFIKGDAATLFEPLKHWIHGFEFAHDAFRTNHFAAHNAVVRQQQFG